MITKVSSPSFASTSVSTDYCYEELPDDEDKTHLIMYHDLSKIQLSENSLKFDSLNSDNLRAVKMLNVSTLPIFYDYRFYAPFFKPKDNSADNSLFWTKLAYFNECLVGTIFCKILKAFDSTHENKNQNFRHANIQILACSPTFRRRGIGSILLRKLLAFCESENKSCTSIENSRFLDENIKQNNEKHQPRIQTVYLHCQTTNENALRLYKKFGFNITDRINNYYRRIDPAQAYRMELQLF